MLVSVRLDDDLISNMKKISPQVNRSDFIREAILYYLNYKKLQDRENILKAVEKTKEFDLKENLELNGTLSDGI
jgi:metal-responsive CopG/Arc/MetJ family transcriptional regulator